jgi:hypothetical protein
MSSLHPQGKNSWYLFNTRLGGPQKLFECGRNENSLCLQHNLCTKLPYSDWKWRIQKQILEWDIQRWTV